MERIENVRELVAGAAAWAEIQDPDAGEGTGGPVERYLTQAALVTPAHEQRDEAGGPPTTAHMFEGLEGAIVALPGIGGGVFSLTCSHHAPGGGRETRRRSFG